MLVFGLFMGGAGAPGFAPEPAMTELRWNPTVREWVSTASHRQDRPQMPDRLVPVLPGLGARAGPLRRSTSTPTTFPRSPFRRPSPPSRATISTASRARTGSAMSSSTIPTTTPRCRSFPLEHLVKLVKLWRQPLRRAEGDAGHPLRLDFRKQGRGDWRHHAASARADLRVSVHSAAGGEGTRGGARPLSGASAVPLLRHPEEGAPRRAARGGRKRRFHGLDSFLCALAL